MGGPPLAQVERLVLDVPILPLIQQKMEVRQFLLVRPIIALRTDPNGRTSWDFAEARQSKPNHRTAAAEQTTNGTDWSLIPSARAQSAGGLSDLKLGDVRIIDGRVAYADETTGTYEQIDAVNVTLALDAITGPFQATGRGTWNNQEIPFELTATSVQTILDGADTELDLKLKSALVTATFDGKLTLQPTATADGALSAQSPSLKRLVRWVGTELPNAPAFGAMSLTGTLVASADQISLGSSRIQLPNADGGGNIAVALAGARPRVDAELNFTRLDLDAFQAAEGNGSGGDEGKGKDERQQQSSSNDDAIGDLLRTLDTEPSTHTQAGNRQRRSGRRWNGEGWDPTPIDLTALRAIDATARVTAQSLRVAGLSMQQARLDSTLRNGLLQATLAPTQLHGGTIEANKQVDARRDVPDLQLNAVLSNVAARALLMEAAEVDWLEGATNATINVTSSGRSIRAMVKRLNGRGDVHFANGALIGVNIPELLRRAQQGQFDGLSSDNREKTDFSSLAGTYTIQNGILQNDDLDLIGPLIRITGAGTVDLPQRRLDYRVRPKLVASLQGQGRSSQRGLEVPFKVTGSWDNPNIVPDVGALLSNPEDALDAVRQLG